VYIDACITLCGYRGIQVLVNGVDEYLKIKLDEMMSKSWSGSRSKMVATRSIFLPALAVFYCSLSVPTSILAAEKAAVLFQELCSVCHGATGKGDGPSAQGLEPKPADFTNCQAMAKDSDEVLFKIIKGGGQSAGRSTVMPAWGDSLSEQQIRELVKFIRGLCKK
jgi:mono/diheme cytochrome c family protein